MTHPQRLAVLDELFLHLEGPNTHMHVGGAAIFEGPPPDYEEVLDMVRERLHMVPRFRQKLATVPFGLGRPVWVDDTHFNLEYHVRHTALPAPGDDEKFKRLVARIMSQQLDRSKPLWEIWFAEGLGGGRFGLISKTHHCLVDGVSGADIMSVILDLTPEKQVHEERPWKPDPEPPADQLLIDALKERLTSPGEIVRSIQSTVLDPARLPNRFVESAKAISAFVGGSLDFAPTSSLNQPIGPHRRFETVLVPLDEIKTIKNSLGGTVNDVVLAVVAGGLRRLLKGRGEKLDDLELRAMVPVSVRAEAERGALGNRVASIWAPLPVYEEDPEARLRIVSETMKDLKSSGQAVGAQLLTSLGEYAPPTIIAQASRLVARQRAFNLVVTNVPGPQIPLYSLGRQMTEVYPVVPLSDNTTIGIALLSYNGTIGFGLIGDYDTAPDLGVLAEGIEKAIAELSARVPTST
ncbi:MAG TPA: wax ester/triacylglycerol synthase family O-acyltransferase [Actinomycetota bacterium]|nr:wax ester/triacylglycerol synthase family O-acyltransferase [Actinomycetota bacterium]